MRYIRLWHVYKIGMEDYNGMGRDTNSRKARKETLRTLFTIDTFEPLANSHPNKQNKSKQPRHNSKSQHHQRRHSSISQHYRSQFQVLSPCKRRRDSTPINRLRRPSSMNNCQQKRCKTEHSAGKDPNKQCLKKLLRSLKRGLDISANAQVPNKKLFSGEREDCWQVKDHPNKLLIRTGKVAVRKQYEAEMSMRSELSRVLKGRQVKKFMKVESMSREGDKWAIVTDRFYHCKWNQDVFYWFLSELKGQPLHVSQVIRQVAEGLQSLTRHGYSHLNVSLEAVNFPICQGSLVYSESSVKLGMLRGCCKLSSTGLPQMPYNYRTPPQIINYLRFQQSHSFDRDSLQWVARVAQSGWKIDVWALGILTLQLLNGGPLADEHRRAELWQNQCQLLIRYSYLLTNLPETLKLVLINMLSINPSHRPHPTRIVQALSSLHQS